MLIFCSHVIRIGHMRTDVLNLCSSGQHLYTVSIRTGHVSAYMLDVLNWLPLQQRIMFRIGAMIWRCILGFAPAYLRDLCCPTPGTRGRSSLRSSEQGLLFVPFARTSTTQA